jgi:hypothetical protein
MLHIMLHERTAARIIGLGRARDPGSCLEVTGCRGRRRPRDRGLAPGLCRRTWSLPPTCAASR